MHEDLDADLFGFTIWPRLNAAWRMDSPYKAVNLILNNWDTLNKTIAEIEQLNEQRKFLTKEFVNDAMNKIDKNANLIFYVSPAIEHGIIWIVAWRITEQLYRPCICMKDEWDKLVASCRSPEFFSMIELLDKFKDYFIGYGWHKQAAGFSISKEKFPEFRTKIISEINKENFSHYKKEIIVDKVIRLEELGFNFLAKVNKYKPFGIGNTKPIFMVENLDYEKMEFLWKWRDHLRFSTKHWFKIFAFYMWDYYEKLKIWKREWKKIDLIFDVSEDSWMGKKNLMLKVVDVVLG
jgi:single-stranded-DNA-specific exonuclease